MNTEKTTNNTGTDAAITEAVKTSIVIGGSKNRKVFTLFLGLAVVIAIATVIGGVLLYQKSKEPLVQIDPKKDVTVQIQALTPKQAVSVASQSVDPQKDPDTAYVKAVAQAETGNAKASVETFAAVVAAKPQVKYYVYYDYAIAAAKANNLSLAITQMQKAIDVLAADGSVSSTVKKSETENMENKIIFFRIEDGS